MHGTTKKLMRTDMKEHQAHVHFNACMLTNVFGCGVVKFNVKQLRELKRIY